MASTSLRRSCSHPLHTSCTCESTVEDEPQQVFWASKNLHSKFQSREPPNSDSSPRESPLLLTQLSRDLPSGPTLQRCTSPIGAVQDFFSAFTPGRIRSLKFSLSKQKPPSVTIPDLLKKKLPPVIIHEPHFTSHIFSPTYESVQNPYDMREQIGKGAMGLVYRCIERESGREWACKTVKKTSLRSPAEVATIRQEVAAMLQLKAHPAVVTLHDVVEDVDHIHLIMELCRGGELFEAIVTRIRFTESDSAHILQSLLSVVHFMHSKGIMHRDLKPENVVLANRHSSTNVRVIDFGQATGFKKGSPLSALVGSLFYVAPEVIRASYGPEADLWSTGVMLYALLCGSPPFWADKDGSVFDKVVEGRCDVENGLWRRVSGEAKDLVKRLLTVDCEERISARDALRHPWILRHCRPHISMITNPSILKCTDWKVPPNSPSSVLLSPMSSTSSSSSPRSPPFSPAHKKMVASPNPHCLSPSTLSHSPTTRHVREAFNDDEQRLTSPSPTTLTSPSPTMLTSPSQRCSHHLHQI